jgi:hypothetical protein
VDRKFIMTAFGYAILGLMLGIYMAASKDHGEFVTHAHIMLLGFVVSFIYALCHKLWLNNSTSTLAVVQFYIHLVASFVLFVGLFLLYGKFVEMEQIDPVLAGASIAAFIGLILMFVMLVKAPRNA